MVTLKIQPLPAMSGTDVAEFRRMVNDEVGEDACWLWQGRTQASHGTDLVSGLFDWGTGRNGRRLLVHRIGWWLHTGDDPFPDIVYHICQSGHCVNPRHLRRGTARDKLIHTYQSGRRTNVKLTADEVRVIRRRRATGESVTALAGNYRVSLATVSHIVHRHTWQHVDSSAARAGDAVDSSNIVSAGPAAWRGEP